jgi:dTDP-4-amino-4,6-dideoxygalactose transaminase
MLPSLAEIGRRQLEQLDSNLAHRRKIARWLEQRVGWYDGSLNGDFDDQAWLRYSFLVRDADQFDRRFGKNIELGRWFPHNIFGREHDAASVGYVAGSCPVAERICQHIVNLPTHSRLPLELFEALWAAHGGWLTSQIIRGDIPPEGRNR